jgi:immune inhibitor A
MTRSLLRFSLVLCLFTLLWPALPGQAMPPNPRLLEDIKQGRIQLPLFMQHPEIARQKGINDPWVLRAPPEYVPLSGNIRALAVLVDFSDKVSTVTPGFFDTLIFAPPVTGLGSVADYFKEVSYGQVDIITVNWPSWLAWVRAPQTYSYYVDGAYGTDHAYPHNCQKLAEDIVDAISPYVNFANYDNNGDGECEPIMLIHAGSGADHTGSHNDIWSHSWHLAYPRTYNGKTISKYVIMPEYWDTVSASTSDMGPGVFCHEMGHGFWGLPDLYDRDYSSKGIGYWSLMAAGSWNGPLLPGGSHSGSSPAWPDAWSRIKMGFAVPITVNQIRTHSILQALDNPPPAPTILKILFPSMQGKEYFLLENRQQVPGSYDEYLPGNGLLLWHVDEAVTTQNDQECEAADPCNCPSQHYLVALVQADAELAMEKGWNKGDAGDPYPGSSGNRNCTHVSHPSSNSWYNCGASGIEIWNIWDSGPTMTASLIMSYGLHYTLSGALDNDTLFFSTDGSSMAVWFGQTLTSIYGGSAAQSGTISHSESTALRFGCYGPGSLTFYWKVSCEQYFDFLGFYVDGALQPGAISGEQDWQQKSFAIPSGYHVLQWVYDKDSSVNRGLDCGWVDKVVFTKTAPAISPLMLLLLAD